MRRIFAAIFHRDDLVVRMNAFELILDVETGVVGCSKGHPAVFEKVCNVFLCLGAGPALQERIMRPCAVGGLQFALGSECLQGFQGRLVILSADEAAEECTSCTHEVGAKENTLSRLVTMPHEVLFFFLWGVNSSCKTFGKVLGSFELECNGVIVF